MKKSQYSVLALSTATILAGNAFAAVSGNIGGTSNYLWRGAVQPKPRTRSQSKGVLTIAMMLDFMRVLGYRM